MRSKHKKLQYLWYLEQCKKQREQELEWRAIGIANELSWACCWDSKGNIKAVKRSG